MSKSHNRSRSPSGDHSESLIVKICPGHSESDIRAFFKGVEVDVRKLLLQLTHFSVGLQA